MSAPEPHPRRQRSVGRALVSLVVAVVLLISGAPGVGAEESTQPTLPTTTEPEAATPTTEAAATTTEAPATTAAPTSTAAPTTTSQVRRVQVADDDEEVVPDDVTDDTEADGGDEAVEETTTTARDLLVSGDGSQGSESTTTTSTTVVEVAADDGISEETQVWLIVAGLVAVALLIGAWTVRYWIRTRPEAAR